MLAELHAESGIQPVQTAGQAPGLFGQHVCDESIIDFLKNCQLPDGPYVHAKPVCWRDKKQKEGSRQQWTNLLNSDTFVNFAKSISTKKNVHVGLFQTKDLNNLEQTETAKRIRSDARAKATAEPCLAVSPRRTRRMGGAKARTLETAAPPTRESMRRAWKQKIKCGEAEIPRKQKVIAKEEERALKKAKNRFHVWGAAVVRDSESGWHAFIFDTDAGPLKEKNYSWTVPYWKGPVHTERQEYFDSLRERDWLCGPQTWLVELLRKKFNSLTVWIGDVDGSDKWQGNCVQHTTRWVLELSAKPDGPFDRGAADDARFQKFRKFGRK
jgi:hypothetical protein